MSFNDWELSLNHSDQRTVRHAGAPAHSQNLVYIGAYTRTCCECPQIQIACAQPRAMRCTQALCARVLDPMAHSQTDTSQPAPACHAPQPTDLAITLCNTPPGALVYVHTTLFAGNLVQQTYTTAAQVRAHTTPALLTKVKKLVADPQFKPARVKASSPALLKLCTFIIAYEDHDRVVNDLKLRLPDMPDADRQQQQSERYASQRSKLAAMQEDCSGAPESISSNPPLGWGGASTITSCSPPPPPPRGSQRSRIGCKDSA